MQSSSSRRGATVQTPASLFGAQVAASESSSSSKYKKVRKSAEGAAPAGCGCKGTPPAASPSTSHAIHADDSSNLPGPPTGGVKFCEPDCSECPTPIVPKCCPTGNCRRCQPPPVSSCDDTCTPFYDPANWCKLPSCPEPPKPDPCKPPVWTPDSVCKFNTGCGWMNASLSVSAVVRTAQGALISPPAGKDTPLYFKSVGDIVTFTYCITNTGQVPLDFPLFLVNEIMCPMIFNPVSIYPKNSACYTRNYTITAADLVNKKVCDRAIGYLKFIATCDAEKFLCTNDVNICIRYGDAKIGVFVDRDADPTSYGAYDEVVRVAYYNEGTTQADLTTDSTVAFTDFGYVVAVTPLQTTVWTPGPSYPDDTPQTYAAKANTISVPAGGSLVYTFGIKRQESGLKGSVLKAAATVAIKQYDGDGSANNTSAFTVIVN